ncbi:MAG: DUF2461 domain-containing protein [Bacteroidota bacterium]
MDQNVLNFLKDLSKNNYREWFHENKKRWEKEAKKPFQAFVAHLIEKIQEVDPELVTTSKESIFRIHRDTRFSKDKTPYKTHLSAFISRHGKKNKELPGFYIQLGPGSLMMGGGAYFMETATLKRLREHISLHPQEFHNLVTDANFLEKFEEIKGEKHKRIPKEYRDFHETQPLIANKQFYYMAEMDPNTITQDNFIDIAFEHYKVGRPLNEFLEAGMIG